MLKILGFPSLTQQACELCCSEVTTACEHNSCLLYACLLEMLVSQGDKSVEESPSMFKTVSH